MCGRYYIAEDDAAEELRQIIEAVNRRSPDAKTGGEIRPGDTVPVLANRPSLQPGAYAMHWGYTLPDGKLLFNARSETAAEKAIFKDGMAQRRCLIPATCYFEWEHRGKEKIKYAIAPANNDMIYLAGIYGDVFTIPEGYFPKVGARVMSLQEPTRKMSKSDPEETYIAILDKPDVIRRKVRRAVTDCDNSVVFDAENKPGVANLMSIMSALTGNTMDEITAEFDGQGYGKFKDAVADSVIAVLEPIQNEYDRISADKAYLQQVMDSGRERASAIAHKTMLKVRKKLGIAPWKL